MAAGSSRASPALSEGPLWPALAVSCIGPGSMPAPSLSASVRVTHGLGVGYVCFSFLLNFFWENMGKSKNHAVLPASPFLQNPKFQLVNT